MQEFMGGRRKPRSCEELGLRKSSTQYAAGAVNCVAGWSGIRRSRILFVRDLLIFMGADTSVRGSHMRKIGIEQRNPKVIFRNI